MSLGGAVKALPTHGGVDEPQHGRLSPDKITLPPCLKLII